VPHEYGDKYALSAWLTRSALGALRTALASKVFDLDDSKWSELVTASKKKQVRLRLKSDEKCTFLRKVEREEKSATKEVTKVEMLSSLSARIFTF